MKPKYPIPSRPIGPLLAAFTAFCLGIGLINLSIFSVGTSEWLGFGLLGIISLATSLGLLLAPFIEGSRAGTQIDVFSWEDSNDSH